MTRRRSIRKTRRPTGKARPHKEGGQGRREEEEKGASVKGGKAKAAKTNGAFPYCVMELNSVRPSTPNMVLYDDEEEQTRVNNTVLSATSSRPGTASTSKLSPPPPPMMYKTPPDTAVSAPPAGASVWTVEGDKTDPLEEDDDEDGEGSGDEESEDEKVTDGELVGVHTYVYIR